MRVTTLAQQQFSLEQIKNLQTRMANENISISSGVTAQRYSGIAEDSKRLVNLQATHESISRFVDNNTVIDQRLQTMETNVSQLGDIASQIRTQLVSALNAGNAADSGINVLAQNLLDQVSSILNVSFDGRYLFSGSMTNTAPVDLSDPMFVVPPATYPSTPDLNYYQGDQQILSTRADTDLTVNYGVTAADPAIEKLIRTLHLVATSVVSPVPDTSRLQDALGVAEEAANEIPQIVSQIGAARKSLETANSVHNETLLYTEQTIGDLQNTDLAQAITLLNADQSSLQASFATLAQMRQVSLLNYL
jgi:flagellar hook-associated protein 3 FlgL